MSVDVTERPQRDGESLFVVGMGLRGTALLSSLPETRPASTGPSRSSIGSSATCNYIFGLRPSILADRQLDQALRDLGKEIQNRSGSRVEVEVEAELAASFASRSHHIVQLVRDALSNVARHAQAKHSLVRLARRETTAVLTIEDDGVGFDVRGDSAGNGLRNMRERAAAVGGTLHLTSKAGKGTKLRLIFPA
jgi:signal transduction histidine kinase